MPAIDTLESLEINGTSQSVLYSGTDTSKPVVLFVHGGPGYPLMWYSRAFDDEFIEDFVVVHWDQRGTGKSCSKDVLPETITLAQIVVDGLTLTEHLKRKFHTEKIILVGHSWGTLVAANMAQRSPEDFRAFVSVGTCADWKRGEELRYSNLLKQADKTNHRDAIQRLDNLGPPPYLTAAQTEEFGNMIIELEGFSGTSRKLSENELSAAIEMTQEYSGEEIEAALVALSENLDLLGEFCNDYVLQNEVTELDVPVYFVQGEHDTNTPTVLAKEYFDALVTSKEKRWILFEDAAHLAMYEDREHFLHVLKSTVQSRETS